MLVKYPGCIQIVGSVHIISKEYESLHKYMCCEWCLCLWQQGGMQDDVAALSRVTGNDVNGDAAVLHDAREQRGMILQGFGDDCDHVNDSWSEQFGHIL